MVKAFRTPRVQALAVSHPCAGCLHAMSRSKRMRLSDDQRDVLRGVCRRGSISNEGLQFLLARIREHPDLKNVSRTELRGQFHARYDMVKTSIPLEMNDGRWRDWSVADPGLLLSMVLRERPELAHMFAVGMEAHPCSASNPWSIIVGLDEYTPGNKTKLNNRRKCMVTSYSFLELGLENLGRDAAWMTPAVALHTSIVSTKGGWSCMLKLLLKLLLVGTHGLQTVGVCFIAQGRDFVLFGCLALLLSDGDGLREALDWKGAKGVKLCFRHWNVVNKNMDLVERDPARQYVELKCYDHAKFKCWSPRELEASIDMLTEARRRVDAGAMTHARLESLEKRSASTLTSVGSWQTCGSVHYFRLAKSRPSIGCTRPCKTVLSLMNCTGTLRHAPPWDTRTTTLKPFSSKVGVSQRTRDLMACIASSANIVRHRATRRIA